MASCVIVFQLEPLSWRNDKGLDFTHFCALLIKEVQMSCLQGWAPHMELLDPAGSTEGQSPPRDPLGEPWPACSAHQHPPIPILRAWPSASSRAHLSHLQGCQSNRAPCHSSPSGTSHLPWLPLSNASSPDLRPGSPQRQWQAKRHARTDSWNLATFYKGFKFQKCILYSFGVLFSRSELC